MWYVLPKLQTRVADVLLCNRLEWNVASITEFTDYIRIHLVKYFPENSHSVWITTRTLGLFWYSQNYFLSSCDRRSGKDSQTASEMELGNCFWLVLNPIQIRDNILSIHTYYFDSGCKESEQMVRTKMLPERRKTLLGFSEFTLWRSSTKKAVIPSKTSLSHLPKSATK